MRGPEKCAVPSRIPSGMAESPLPLHDSIQIPFIIFDRRFFQHGDQVLPERPLPVMFGLVGDILRYRRPRRRADGEGRISFLPRKISHAAGGLHPNGGCFFQFTHEIAQSGRGFQPKQQMHMVGYPAHPLGESAETFDGAAKVFVEAGEDLMVDQGLPVLGAENHMIMQTEISGGHRLVWLGYGSDLEAERGFAGIPAGMRAFCWGCSGDVAALNPRLMALIPPGSIPHTTRRWQSQATAQALVRCSGGLSANIRQYPPISANGRKWSQMVANGRKWGDSLSIPEGSQPLAGG